MKWPSLRRPIEAPKQLLVEGRTAEIFFREFVEALGLREQMEVRDFLSLSDLTDFLKLFTTYKEFKEKVVSVGVIRDAEDKPAAAAFDSVCSSLRAAGLPCPQTLGTVAAGPPRTAMFILPDCQEPGMLETVCWQALQADPQARARVSCVEAYLDCLRRVDDSPHNEAKARVWAYLSGRGEFDPLVGRAAQAKTWDWRRPAFQRLTTFLRAL